MAVKLLCLFVLGVVSQGHALTEIVLEDATINHTSNPLTGTSLSVPKPIFDTLVSCAVIFPNNIIYEAFPEDKLPLPSFTFGAAMEPFRSCMVQIRDAPVSASGAYQLIAVTSAADGSQTRTRRNFNLNIREFGVEWPSV